MEHCLADCRIQFGHSIQACSSAGLDVSGRKTNWLASFLATITELCLQEKLRILMKNRIHKE